MKRKIVLVVGAVLLGFSGMAQDFGSDSSECAKNVSLYDGHMRNKLYDKAVGFWRKALEICPGFGESIYINGAIMYEDFISNVGEDEARKAELIDTLLNVIWAGRVQYYPTPDAWGRYGTAALKYNQVDAEFALACFDNAFEAGPETVSLGTVLGSYQALYLVYARAIKGDDEELKQQLKDRLISDYLSSSAICVARMAESTSWQTVADNLEKYFSKAISDCEDLIAVATEKYEATPDDCDVVKNMLKLLDMRGCTDNDIYETMAVKYYADCEQSPEAAYSLGVMYMGKDENSTAAKYFKEAYDGCVDCAEKCTYALAAAGASLQAGSYKTAASYARDAISCDPGQAYYIIGRAVAGTAGSCGDDAFTQKATYWLAMDYMEKAKNNGYSGASSAYDSYASNAPSLDLKFDYGYTGKEGTSYTVECWGETTTVR